MESKGHDPQAGLSRRSLLALLAGLAGMGVAGMLLMTPRGNGDEGSFNPKSWPVRTVEIKNFAFNPETATVIWREYEE